VFHDSADVAVIQIRNKDVVKPLAGRALTPPLLLESLEAPPRERALTILGFPLGLGALVLGPDARVSPITRESRTASGLITLRRGDTKKPAVFFLLDNPSIGGFSGAPVFLFPAPFGQDGALVIPSGESVCVGLVHGTQSDETGGKLTLVVPASSIVDTLKKAYEHRRPAA